MAQVHERKFEGHHDLVRLEVHGEDAPLGRQPFYEYARPGLVEWWENRREGLEQGFTVTAAQDERPSWTA